MQGVLATDSEEGTLPASAINHDDPVDTTVNWSYYKVTYDVTDSDHNYVEKAGLVFVGPWEPGDYVLRADDFSKSIGDVLGTEAEVISESNATAIDARPILPDGTPNPAFGDEVSVRVSSDGGYYTKTPGTFTINIEVIDDPTYNKDIVATVGAGSGPVITFTDYPLVINQTPLASHVLTDDELKAALQVTDAEDYSAWVSDASGRAQDLYKNMVVTPLDGTNPTTIDTRNIGVTRVRYQATDSTGNPTTAYRAVVVTDGRYIIEDEDGDGKNDIILGARNFVVQQSAVQRSESAIKGLSYAEAYTADGLPVNVALDGGIPVNYTTGSAPAGDYNFRWKADGFTVTKAIVGKVVVADVIDPGSKDSQYAIYASHFVVNTIEAATVVASDSFIVKAQAHIVKLVAAAPDKGIEINDRGGFAATPGNYPITFNITGIPPTSQKVIINGVVTNGQVPVITAKTPLNVWIGAGAAPAGSITAAAYTALYDVTAIDPDGGGKGDPSTITDDIPSTITSSVVATAVGAPVDLTTVGTYQVNLSVTDADGNIATTDRLVIVNDGRYEVGLGRVLFAKPFVVLANSVAATDAAKLAQVRALTGTKLLAGSNESSSILAGDILPADQTSFPNLGGYTNAVGVYPITVNGVDHPASAPAISRIVQAEVIDADVVESGPHDDALDTYYVLGNNIMLTPLEADAIQADADPQQALLNALGAEARKTNADGTLSTVAAEIDDDDNFFARATGVLAIGSYAVTIKDSGDNVTADLIVIVATGKLPKLELTPIPLVIPIDTTATGNLTEAQLMAGVTATDEEDDLAGIPLAPAIDGTVNIPANAASVTKVTYTVTDTAGNTVTASRAVIVDDGSFVYNTNYILQGNSFIIKSANVNMSDRAGQIKTESEAAAWRADGTTLALSRIAVTDEGGYQNVIGEYPVKLGLLDDVTLERSLTAKVVGDKIVDNGERYSILGENFFINVPDANSTLTAANLEAQFITRAGVQSYLRSGDLSFEQGTKKLVSATKQGTGQSFISQIGSLAEGDKFDVTFWVNEDHTASITVLLTVSNRTAPVLNVLTPKSIKLGAAFPEGAFADTTPSYMQGVSANDSEDGTIAASAIKHDKGALILDPTKEFDVNVKGAYKVTYNVTDSDHNTVEQGGAVLVDLTAVVGPNYTIAGDTPIRLKVSEVAAANADLRKIASITAWKNDDFSPANTTLTPAQLTATAGSQTIRFTVQAEPVTFFDVTFLIDDDRLAVTYFANGATSGNPPAAGLYSAGTSVVVPDQATLQRTGYTFGGWSFTGNGGAAYQAGQRFTIHDDTMLYAVWNPIPVVQPPIVIVQPPIVITTPPVVVPGAPAATPAPIAQITQIPTPYVVQVPLGTPDTVIDPEPIPQGPPGSWSLVSLLLSIFILATAVILALLNLRRRDEDEYLEDDQQTRPAYLRALSYVTALLALVPGILFFALDNLSGPMQAVNNNTVLIAITFLIICVLIAVRAILNIVSRKNTGGSDSEFATTEGGYLG
jgi:hypothetical protein